MNAYVPWLTVFALAIAGPAAAVTFTANSSIDAPDNNPGDGLCRSDGLPASSCTLRAAIMEANALPGLHTILLQEGRTYTLTRTGQDNTGVNGDLDITKSLIISCVNCEESPAIVNANGVDRAFDIHSATAILNGFHITGASPIDPDGGAIKVRAGAQQLFLMNMNIIANVALNGAVSRGGAIYSQAQLGIELRNTEIAFNAANGEGAAIFAENGGPVRVYESVIHGNGPIAGEVTPRVAVRVIGSGLTLRNTTISGNVGNGVALHNPNDEVWLRNSTIANNMGGFIVSNAGADTVRVRNTIIAHNGQDCVFVLTTPDVEGYNVFSDLSCDPGTLGSTNYVEQDPLLTPLKRRMSGTLPLHWPRIDSVVLSNGALEPHPDYRCEDVDQIGTPRPQGFNGIEHCDRGAAEVPDDAIFFDSLETL